MEEKIVKGFEGVTRVVTAYIGLLNRLGDVDITPGRIKIVEELSEQIGKRIEEGVRSGEVTVEEGLSLVVDVMVSTMASIIDSAVKGDDLEEKINMLGIMGSLEAIIEIEKTLEDKEEKEETESGEKDNNTNYIR